MGPVERASRIDLSIFEQGVKAYADDPGAAMEWLKEHSPFDSFAEGIAAAEDGTVDIHTLARIDLARRNAGGKSDDAHLSRLGERLGKRYPDVSRDRMDSLLRDALIYFRKNGL